MPAWESQLAVAQEHANFGRNTLFLQICEDLLKEYVSDKALLLRVSSLYLGYGFPGMACHCLINALTTFSDDPDCLLNIAHAYLQLGQLEQCQEIFTDLHISPSTDEHYKHILPDPSYTNEQSPAREDHLDLDP
jgi:hypothetical protein